jgi:putative FmdB family regulatory protein
MPIYEYHCNNCDATFERFHRSAAVDSEIACPTCGRASRRRLSTFARPRGATPGPDHPEHPAPPAGADGHDHGHSHGPGGHGHDALHGHQH